MSAVLRLVWTYFTATPLLRALSATGLAFSLYGVAGHLLVPRFALRQAMMGQSFGWETLVITLPWLGLILLLASSALMPAIVERIALGRSVWVLPGGRLRLLASAVLTALLLSLLVASQAVIVFVDYSIPAALSPLFYRTLLMAFIDFGLIYTAIWLVGKTSGVWRLVGALGVIVSITIPLRFLSVGPLRPFSFLEGIGLAGWFVFAALLLFGGRVRHGFRGVRGSVTRIAQRMSPAAHYRAGKELDLMLGLSRPWIVALGQIIPIAVMAVLIPESRIWLVVLMLFGAIAGAITSQAASRGRRLWLRYDWNREALVHHVERAFWRYNAWSLAVLLVLYLALAIYADFSQRLIGHGLILLVLGFATCTYLGLMITRSLGWFESSLCILTLSALIVAAIATARDVFTVAIEIEILLVALTIAYRYIALSRWSALDWMRCRSEVQARTAA
jgi:hypothetical protein